MEKNLNVKIKANDTASKEFLRFKENVANADKQMRDLTQTERLYRDEIKKLKNELKNNPFAARGNSALITQKENILAEIKTEREALKKTIEYQTSQKLNTLNYRLDAGTINKQQFTTAQDNLLGKNFEAAQKQMQEYSGSVNLADKASKTLTSAIKRLALAALPLISFTAFAKGAVDYNRQIEKITAGLVTLNVVTQKNYTLIGENVSVTQKYNRAAKESEGILRQLQKVSSSTPQSLQEIATIYKAMYPSMRGVGASNEQIAKVTEKIAVLASSAGMEMGAVVSAVDGLASGTVLVNSEMGRLLRAIGLNNEELKKSDNVVELITEKLKDVKPIETFDSRLNRAKASMNEIMGYYGKPLFEFANKSLAAFNKNLDETVEKIRNAELLKNKYSVNNEEDAKKIEKLLREQIKELEKDINVDFYYIGRPGAREYDKDQIKRLEQQIRGVWNSLEDNIAADKLREIKNLNAAIAESALEASEALAALGRTERDNTIAALDKQKAVWEKQGGDKIKIAEWYNAEIAKLDHEQIKTTKQLQSEIYKITHTSHENSLYELNEQRKEYEKEGLNKLLIEKWYAAEKKEIEKEITKAQKEEAKKREDNELAAAKLLNDENKIKEIEKKRFIEQIDELGMTSAEKEKALQKYVTEIELEEQIKRLTHWEKYYKALGDEARANQIRAQRKALELEKTGLKKEEINKIQKNGNYESFYGGLGASASLVTQLGNRINIIEKFKQAELDRIKTFYRLSEDEARAHAKTNGEILEAEFNAAAGYAEVGFGTMASLAKMFYDASDGQSKGALRAYQALAIAQATINAYLSASNAYAKAGNPYLGAAMAALAIAQGMAQVAQIKAQKFHTGGYVTGAANEVPAVLQRGEYVVSRQGVNALDNINKGNIASGGSNIEVVLLDDRQAFESYVTSRKGSTLIKKVIRQ
jgi:hypothetical protein